MPASSGCATTSARTASRASCSACPAASIRRSVRGTRGRRARRGTRARGDDAVPLHRARGASPTPQPAPRRSACRYDVVPIEPPVDGFETALAPVFAGAKRGRHGGEPAGARPRHPPDGAVEQARLAGAHDRQQERDVGRLRHALRRHEWRLQSDQGPLQDRGLPPRALAQRAAVRGRCSDHRARSSRNAIIDQAPSAELRPEPDRPAIRFRPIRCSTPSWTELVEKETSPSTTSSPAATTRDGAPYRASGLSSSTSGGRPRRA